jgi:hypothetical protein
MRKATLANVTTRGKRVQIDWSSLRAWEQRFPNVLKATIASFDHPKMGTMARTRMLSEHRKILGCKGFLTLEDMRMCFKSARKAREDLKRAKRGFRKANKRGR